MQPVDVGQIPPVDFQRLMEQMRIMGCNLDNVSMYANIARPCLYDYLRGATPMHLNGERLVELWCQLSGNHRDQVPRKYIGHVTKRTRITKVFGTPTRVPA